MSDMTIRTVTEIDAPAAAAWALLGEGFGEWDQWAPGIQKSTLEGPLAQGVFRVNEAPSLGVVRQELVQFDPEGRALAYEMRSGLPPFLSGLRNDWLIQEAGEGRCRLEGEAVFRLQDAAAPMRPQLEGKMSGVLSAFAQAFKHTLEAR